MLVMIRNGVRILGPEKRKPIVLDHGKKQLHATKRIIKLVQLQYTQSFFGDLFQGRKMEIKALKLKYKVFKRDTVYFLREAM